MAYSQNKAVAITVCWLILYLTIAEGKYYPTWESLDARPLPSWYDEAKIGIFIHWGVFSVPSYGSEWFWYAWKGNPPAQDVIEFMKQNYPPNFTYGDFASMYTTEFFNPDQWADLFNASGARYVVMTSKHHEGFTNWPSSHSFNWNSMAVGPKKDLVGMLADSIRNRTNIRFGLYHSLFEWFNPLLLEDYANSFTTDLFSSGKSMPELYEIVNQYKPEIVWSDGDWYGPAEYWKSQEFLAWLYNDSPVKDTVVTNDRWGWGCTCHHGGYFTCSDRYNPGTLQTRKWENAFTIDKYSWGYVRNSPLENYLTMDNITQIIAETISCGGNILINVGPTKDGMIDPILEERLRQMGDWLRVNGEAIYETTPWVYQNDSYTPNVWYTSKKDGFRTKVYAIVLEWPETLTLYLAYTTPTRATTVTLLGYSSLIEWRLPASHSSGIELLMPVIPLNMMPCQWAWVFLLENLL
ncbi:hypothetical protein CHS0354_021727 [Potamilus streckersoni]|uniref:alpha-L-fucosidase n=1 Tax=Potamilus streckersoni TaxID=2493646 RepID=A0AAE0WFI8_9BIVA|nr:hypothetical protein CHS0354_021727 [Potamilus streckersoni]